MVLTRYQIRNEYGSGDKELYRSAHKDDSEALLEGATMAGLVGVLRQLGDLSEFAAEVFYCLHQELMKTATRGNGLMMRLQDLEAEFPITEKSILSQTDHSTFFYDPGLDWRSNLRIEENFIAPRNLPRFLMDSYEECSAPPQLFLLDKFDVAGSGSCLKRYSDPYSLRIRSASTLMVTSTRKQKKKESYVNGGETREVSKTSHAKLHHLFLLDHDENGNRDNESCVKLKRRQLNEPTSRRGYMEKFLNSSSPYSKKVHDTLDQSCQTKEIEVTVCNIPENLSELSLVYDTENHNEVEIKYTCDDEKPEVPFLPQEITSTEKDLPESEPTVCLVRNSSVKLRSKVNNHTEALALMGEKAEEADSDDKADSSLIFPGFEQTKICNNSDETQAEVLAQVSNVLHHSMEENDLQTGSENLPTPYWQEDLLVKSNLPEISSNSKEDDPQTMVIIEDDDNGLDIQSHDACFSGDSQASSENNTASVTTHEKDLENISDHQESVVRAQECLSSEHCIQSHEERQESPSKTVSAYPTTTSTEFLPCPDSIHDADIGVQVSPSGEALKCSSNIIMEAPVASVSTTPEPAVADWNSEAMALEWFNQNLTEFNLDHDALEPPKETQSPRTLPDDKSYENQITRKLSEEETSLVNGFGRNMLRKVPEQEKTLMGARVDENDSLLEIIRNKSFNLRPVDSSARPNIQVAPPVTNLKVVAMLEKANTLRQAMVGSDDDDSNTWSD